ncbi:hypothetical protein [Sulfurospirillum sp. 1612]|uniref:hypothetical protein n=1 Tax=Sulfurospirillum sp. 1612 TaxID=3094835 RepID=UPI002F93715F
MIKSILKKLIELNPNCIFINSSKIRAFVSNKGPLTKPNVSQTKVLRYKERSNATFANHSSNKELQSLFEEIRNTIKEKNRS